MTSNLIHEEYIFIRLFDFIKYLPVGLGLPMILALYIIIVICQNLIERQVNIRNTFIQTGFLRKVQIDTYSAMLYSNWNFFIKKRKSDLTSLHPKSSTKTKIIFGCSSLIFSVNFASRKFKRRKIQNLLIIISAVLIMKAA